MGLFTAMDRSYGEWKVFVWSPLEVALGDVVRDPLVCKLVGLGLIPFTCKDRNNITSSILHSYEVPTPVLYYHFQSLSPCTCLYAQRQGSI